MVILKFLYTVFFKQPPVLCQAIFSYKDILFPGNSSIAFYQSKVLIVGKITTNCILSLRGYKFDAITDLDSLMSKEQISQWKDLGPVRSPSAGYPRGLKSPNRRSMWIQCLQTQVSAWTETYWKIFYWDSSTGLSPSTGRSRGLKPPNHRSI